MMPTAPPRSFTWYGSTARVHPIGPGLLDPLLLGHLASWRCHPRPRPEAVHGPEDVVPELAHHLDLVTGQSPDRSGRDVLQNPEGPWRNRDSREGNQARTNLTVT